MEVWSKYMSRKSDTIVSRIFDMSRGNKHWMVGRNHMDKPTTTHHKRLSSIFMHAARCSEIVNGNSSKRAIAFNDISTYFPSPFPQTAHFITSGCDLLLLLRILFARRGENFRLFRPWFRMITIDSSDRGVDGRILSRWE